MRTSFKIISKKISKKKAKKISKNFFSCYATEAPDQLHKFHWNELTHSMLRPFVRLWTTDSPLRRRKRSLPCSCRWRRRSGRGATCWSSWRRQSRATSTSASPASRMRGSIHFSVISHSWTELEKPKKNHLYYLIKPKTNQRLPGWTFHLLNRSLYILFLWCDQISANNNLLPCHPIKFLFSEKVSPQCFVRYFDSQLDFFLGHRIT